MGNWHINYNRAVGIKATNHATKLEKKEDAKPASYSGYGFIRVNGEGTIDGIACNLWHPVFRIGPAAFYYFCWESEYGGSCQIGGRTYNSGWVCCWVTFWVGCVFALGVGGISNEMHAKMFIRGFGHYQIVPSITI